MRTAADFASEERPLHPSGVMMTAQCTWRALTMHLHDFSDESGPAADTGSAMHKAAAAFHMGASIAEALRAMGENILEYRQADLSDATSMFLSYAGDDRNSGAEVLLVEHPIKFTIAPLPADPTGEPIHIIGRLDQVRRKDGVLRLNDIKTSKRDPMEVLHGSTFQIAAYCVGASILLNERVEPGPLILPRRYNPRSPSSSPVFYHFPWTFDDIEGILYGVRVSVANIRAGHVHHVPGPDCRWCAHRSPDLCYPKLKEFRRARMQEVPQGDGA